MRRPARSVLVCAFALCFGCGGSPAAPCHDQEGRGETALNRLKVSCAAAVGQLNCAAVADIGGLYVYCPMQQDVTQAADWVVADSAVVVAQAPGVFTAAAPGHTFVHAVWHGLDSTNFGQTPVAVFPGAPPMPTYEIFGSVWQAGRTLAEGAITGALVEVVDGLVAGKSATSGVSPMLLPGYLGSFGGAGYYRILGVPPGTYTVRISNAGYASQERTVTVSGGSPLADFQLTPQ
jgi:hypothetical protein